VRGLEPKKRGPKVNPLASELKKLKADKARLEKKLEQANMLIELQKKVAQILGATLQESDE
jgi:outer membrane murein-binding lipoprotein Lpp